VLLDGATGTELLRLSLGEAGFRGRRFAEHMHALQGNLDVLSLTQPALVSHVHHAYLAAGCDLVRTNTFNATPLVQADYGLASCVYELNVAAARLAKAACAEWTGKTPSQPRFAVGALGPTNRVLERSTASVERRSVTIDELTDAYHMQALGLLDGGCDLLLVETIVDTRGARAAAAAIARAQAERGTSAPVMFSATIAGTTGCLPSGESVARFRECLADLQPYSVGLNCSGGAATIGPHVEALARVADCRISCHPSAGLPDPAGRHPEEPRYFASMLRDLAARGLLDIAGGCCGTTPAHLRALRHAVHGAPPRGVGR
jgi:5-methyltetrahydrofolate--homocysteine methyltransferase